MAPADPVLIHWTQVIRGEYLESPGLSLTRPQVQRLWGLDPRLCDEILESLISVGFLRQTVRAQYVRAESPW